jgi:excisionase family DNA binding protein
MRRPRIGINRLETHTKPFVTVAELSEYWLVSRKLIYKQIEAGTLKAIRLGPRLVRISTTEALKFEGLAKMDHHQSRLVATPPHRPVFSKRTRR